MNPEPSLPRVDACAGLYLDVWTLFGEQSFEPDDVARRLVEHDRDIGSIAGLNEPRRHLDLLTAYGLLERDDDGHYRVRCAPDDSVEEWHHDIRLQLETLHRRVHRRKRRRTDGFHDENRPQDAAFVQREGATYVGTDLDGDVTFRGLLVELIDAVDQHPDTAGVALRSPAALAGEVQQLADRLCSVETMAEVDCPRFEKVNSDVVGEHKDDLEYRLYLRPTR